MQAEGDVSHFRLSKQRAGGCVWLTRPDFRLVFYSRSAAQLKCETETARLENWIDCHLQYFQCNYYVNWLPNVFAKQTSRRSIDSERLRHWCHLYRIAFEFIASLTACVEYNVNYFEYVDCLLPLANKAESVSRGQVDACLSMTHNSTSIGSSVFVPVIF